MISKEQPEVWLQGPIPGITAFLQPVAHALLQARYEVHKAVEDLADNLIWERPVGLASPAFHLQHLRGVLDRLFNYAKGEQLSDTQLNELKLEGIEDPSLNKQVLLVNFSKQVDDAIMQLMRTPGDSLLEPRGVGRKQVPSNVLGLLFHAAEHTQRHTGQLLVTSRVVIMANRR